MALATPDHQPEPENPVLHPSLRATLQDISGDLGIKVENDLRDSDREIRDLNQEEITTLSAIASYPRAQEALVQELAEKIYQEIINKSRHRVHAAFRTEDSGKRAIQAKILEQLGGLIKPQKSTSQETLKQIDPEKLVSSEASKKIQPLLDLGLQKRLEDLDGFFYNFAEKRVMSWGRKMNTLLSKDEKLRNMIVKLAQTEDVVDQGALLKELIDYLMKGPINDPSYNQEAVQKTFHVVLSNYQPASSLFKAS